MDALRFALMTPSHQSISFFHPLEALGEFFSQNPFQEESLGFPHQPQASVGAMAQGCQRGFSHQLTAECHFFT